MRENEWTDRLIKQEASKRIDWQNKSLENPGVHQSYTQRGPAHLPVSVDILDGRRQGLHQSGNPHQSATSCTEASLEL